MDTKTVLKNLEKFHDPKNWAFFTELRSETGLGNNVNYFDAWAINFFKSKRNAAICYEIKTSRADFFSEIKKPKKRRAGLRLSTQFYFVVPQGLVKIEEVPPECGLIEVMEDGSVEITIEAPYRDDSSPSWLFIAAISRRLDKDRQVAFLENESKKQINQVYTAAAQVTLDRYIDKWQKYAIGSREIPDKILEELKLVRAEIFELARDMTSK